jgi:hypothetical protein
MEFISQKEYEELKNDPIKLFSVINQISDKEKRKQAMLEISNEGSIDICEFVVKAIEVGANVFSVAVLMGDIIEKLRLNENPYPFVSVIIGFEPQTQWSTVSYFPLLLLLL